MGTTSKYWLISNLATIMFVIVLCEWVAMALYVILSGYPEDPPLALMLLPAFYPTCIYLFFLGFLYDSLLMRSLLYVVALVACAFVFAIVSEGGEEVNWYGTLWVLIPLVVSMAITIPIAKFTYNNYDEITPRYNRRSNVVKFESQWKYTLDRATVSANMSLIILIPIMLYILIALYL